MKKSLIMLLVLIFLFFVCMTCFLVGIINKDYEKPKPVKKVEVKKKLIWKLLKK